MPILSAAEMSDGSGLSGCVVGLQRSGGGVPKLPVERAAIRFGGMEGDWQRNRKHHGGPDRALCLYSQELIDALVTEGHPMARGAIGENVTVTGVRWARMQPGALLQIGTVAVEVTAYAWPCQTIQSAFLNGGTTRISEKLFPGWSRVYARVIAEGEVWVGAPVAFTGPIRLVPESDIGASQT